MLVKHLSNIKNIFHVYERDGEVQEKSKKTEKCLGNVCGKYPKNSETCVFV